MNANGVVKNYDLLTGEERFLLIFAASGRGDEVERDRLARAAPRITLSLQDHAPYAHAFLDLAFFTFIELVEEAARYFDTFPRAKDTPGGLGNEDEEDEGEAADVVEESEQEDENAEGEPAEVDTPTKPIKHRWIDLALASGYVLRTKTDGWKLFCERLNVPPFLAWEQLPGFDRLQDAFELTEKIAFVEEGFLRWLNRVAPAGKQELTECPLTVEEVASANEYLFRKRVEWWGG
jgi:hypothetical protein